MRQILSDPEGTPDPLALRAVVPSYVDRTPRPVERRPYLEVSDDELARRATLETAPQGRRLKDDLGEGAANLADRIVLEPMRLVTENLGVIGAGIVVLIGLAVATALLGEAASHVFSPLWD